MEHESDRDIDAPENQGSHEISRETSPENPVEPEEIIDLVDVIDDERPEQRIPGEEELRSIIIATTERIARELFPDIAAPIIREEIEKLKGDL